MASIEKLHYVFKSRNLLDELATISVSSPIGNYAVNKFELFNEFSTTYLAGVLASFYWLDTQKGTTVRSCEFITGEDTVNQLDDELVYIISLTNLVITTSNEVVEVKDGAAYRINSSVAVNPDSKFIKIISKKIHNAVIPTYSQSVDSAPTQYI